MMAGFGETVIQEKNVKKRKSGKAKQVKSDDGFADLATERQELKDAPLLSHKWVALWGLDGTGKTGIVQDAYMKDPNRTDKDELWSVDFDDGAAVLHSALHGEDRTFVSYHPWVYNTDERTAYDYPNTHNRVMKLMKYAISIAEKQNNPDYDGKRIWGLHVSGIDLWDSVCINNMRIVDLGLANDGIDAADNRGVGPAERVHMQFDWALRTSRFHQLSALSRRLVRLGVAVFWETHERMRDGVLGPDWEKHASIYLHTIIHCEKYVEKDEEGNNLRTQITATFDKCRANPALLGQQKTILIAKPNEQPEWRGLPALYDGSL